VGTTPRWSEKKKGRALLAVAASTALGCFADPHGCASQLTFPDGGTIPGCYCGNAASFCFFDDGGGVCWPIPDAGSDAGLDGGDAGP
jgi:hypothetical protein